MMFTKVMKWVTLASLAGVVLFALASLAAGGIAAPCRNKTVVNGSTPYTVRSCDSATTTGQAIAYVAGILFIVAVIAAMAWGIAAAIRPMDRALSMPLARGADSAARKASAARERQRQAAANRQQQGHGAGAGAGADYIDGEVIDYPDGGFADEFTDEYAAPQPDPEPPTSDDRPRSGWGRGVSFGD